MAPGLLGLIELLLVVGVVFGLGFAQLASLRRDRRQREAERKAGGAADQASGDQGGGGD